MGRSETAMEMKSSQVSVIIPSLNEEAYLPPLLKSIRSQNLFPSEIILADAGSQDRTVEIALSQGCVIAPGGLPAKGRNEGAKVAQGKYLLFLDSDIILPPGFIKNILEEVAWRNLSTMSFSLKPSQPSFRFSLILLLGYNIPILLLEKILPHGAMGIITTREVFQKLKGFDESITFSEDHDFVRRAAKVGRFGISRMTYLFVSPRRFEKDGWVKTLFKYLLCELHMIFIGPVRKNIFHYRFNHYSEE